VDRDSAGGISEVVVEEGFLKKAFFRLSRSPSEDPEAGRVLPKSLSLRTARSSSNSLNRNAGDQFFSGQYGLLWYSYCLNYDEG